MMSLRLTHTLWLTPGEPPETVSLSDVEGKLRELGGSAQATVTEAARPALGAIVVAGVVAVAAVYLLGRRRGRRRASVLEIRRI
jgi:hypothetical protein